MGYGCNGDPNLIGPEYGFGFGMEAALEKGDKVLIVKTAWGGKTLAGDFRPPSSAAAAATDPFCGPGAAYCAQVGHYYTTMTSDVAKMMAPGVIASMFPDTTGLTPEIAGFGWFQGWNDGCDLNMTAAYEVSFKVVLALSLEPHLPSLCLPSTNRGVRLPPGQHGELDQGSEDGVEEPSHGGEHRCLWV